MGEFPGADIPFGMIQWSPDTSPNAVQAGGGYAYDDSEISGFSLTHLSGTGCPSYQDVPILPTVGASVSTRRRRSPRSRTAGAAGPAATGRARARLRSPSPSPSRRASGISSFDFPPGTASNVLFKVADSVNPVTAASAHVVGQDEVEGQVTSGQFCGTGTNYTVHFVALFDRPFSRPGTWNSSGTEPGTAPARDVLRRLRHLRHEGPTAGTDEGRDLLREHRRSAAEPPGGGSGLVAQGVSTRRRIAGMPYWVASPSGAAPRPSSTPSTRRSTTRCSFRTWSPT